jgi:hypothetical protein
MMTTTIVVVMMMMTVMTVMVMTVVDDDENDHACVVVRVGPLTGHLEDADEVRHAAEDPAVFRVGHKVPARQGHERKMTHTDTDTHTFTLSLRCT